MNTTKPNGNVKMAVMAKDIEFIRETVTKMSHNLEENYATKADLEVMSVKIKNVNEKANNNRRIIIAAAGGIIATVFAAIMYAVFNL